MSVYTDVDRLILTRWQDVMGLFEAHEELQDRVEDVIEGAADRLGPMARGPRLRLRWDTKLPTIFFGRNEWHHRKKDDWAVYFEIGAFAPFGFRKVREDHPFAWVHTQNQEFLRMKEPERIAFAKALRQELGGEANKWAHIEVDDSESPLGRYYTTSRMRRASS